ncbi:MAG: O-antigen ligase family protein [Armatimonadetes bacterium]|nr:O-antigen ligase family protein [Armatimonadota bacterium]
MQPAEENRAEVILRLCLVMVVAVIPLILDPASSYFIFDAPKARAVQLLALFAFAAWLIRERTGETGWDWREPLTRPLVFYAGALIVATILSAAPTIALLGDVRRREGLLTQIAYLAICGLTARELGRPWLVRRWVGLLVATATVVAGYGLLQYTGREPIIRVLNDRPVGSLGNPGSFGGYLAMALPFAVMVFLRARSWLGVGLAGVSISAIFFGILVSYSRAAWGASIGALAMGAWLLLRTRTTLDMRRVVVAVSLMGLLAAAFFWPRSPLGVSGAAGVVPPSERIGENLDIGPRQRVLVWRRALQVIRDRPLFGVGPDLFRFSMDMSTLGPQYRNVLGVSRRTHNVFLEVATTTGLIGLAAFVWTVFTYLAAVWHALPGLSDQRRAVAITSAAGCVGFLLWTQFLPNTSGTSPIFWAMLGMGAAVAGQVGRPAAPPPVPPQDPRPGAR